MEKKKLADEALLNFLDGQGSEEERAFTEAAINNNSDNQIRLKELEAVHFILNNESNVLMPSKNFTEKVMSGLHQKTLPAFLSPKNGFILIIGLLIASFIALSLLSSGAFNQFQTNFNFNEIQLNVNYIKIPTAFNFKLSLFIKGFVMVNLLLAFVLLDRTILRPIFQKRSNMIY